MIHRDALAQARFIWRAAFKGKILAADDAAPAVQLAKPEHVIRRGEAGQRPILVAFGHPAPAPNS
jgi:hypothetical protein